MFRRGQGGVEEKEKTAGEKTREEKAQEKREAEEAVTRRNEKPTHTEQNDTKGQQLSRCRQGWERAGSVAGKGGRERAVLQARIEALKFKLEEDAIVYDDDVKRLMEGIMGAK